MDDAGAQYTSDPVLRAVDIQIQKEGGITQSIDDQRKLLLDLALTFVDIEAADKVPGFRGLYKELLLLNNEVGIHQLALQEVKRTYKPSDKATDFAGLLKEKSRQLQGSTLGCAGSWGALFAVVKEANVPPPSLGQSPDLQQFDRETVGKSPAGGDDDDVQDVVRGESGLRMEKCPLTMKSVYELDDPVADSKEFIYERAAIMDYIERNSRNGEVVKCPVAGTSHAVRIQDLKQSALLERAKRRMKLHQGEQQGTQAGDVYEV